MILQKTFKTFFTVLFVSIFFLAACSYEPPKDIPPEQSVNDETSLLEEEEIPSDAALAKSPSKKTTKKLPAKKKTTALPSAKSEQTVLIQNFSFSPAKLTVKKGTVITWIHEDSVQHNAFSSTPGGPQGTLLSKGQKYSYTANTVGTFDYFCQPHTFMKGTITVTE